MSGRVLFLDIATVTGWCSGVPGEAPESGSLRLAKKGAPEGAVFGGMMRFLGNELTSRDYRSVVFEAPVGPGMDRTGRTTYATGYRLKGLCAITEAVCHQLGIPVSQVGVQTIRRVVLGQGRPVDPKQAVISALRREGYDPSDDNEADAIAGWIYACSVIRQSGPTLFSTSS